MIRIKPFAWCKYEYKSCPPNCPLDAAEARLREAHRRWHECLESYQSPDDFQDALNSAIQALRNVTFVLQAAKSNVPGFDDWYPSQQANMRADRVLRWVVDARNTVVKQGDLSTHSWLRVTLVTGYHDEADAVRVEQAVWADLLDGPVEQISETVVSAPVATSPATVLRAVEKLQLPLRIRQDSALALERRWVVDSLQEYELLSLLAHAYGRLRILVSDCHRLLGLEPARVNAVSSQERRLPDEPEFLDELPQGGRLPCMTSSRQMRTTRWRLLDGTEVTEFRSNEIRPDPSITKELLTSVYGEAPDMPIESFGQLRSKDEISALVSWCRDVGRRILVSGQEHGWFTWYYFRGRPVASHVHITTDAQGKQAIAAEIARLALEYEADLVVLLGEIWMSPLDTTVDGAYHPPSLHSNRREALLIYATAKGGTEVSVVIPFVHVSGEEPNRVVEVQEEMWDQVYDLGVLQPTRRAWGLGPHRRQGESFFRR